MIDHQTTIKKAFTLKGLSLISNRPCQAKFLPAPAGTGIVFKVEHEVIPALIDYLDPTSTHTTNLIKNNYKIKTVEHFLGAVWAMNIDNLIIELSTDGLPFVDFCAEFYAQALLSADLAYLAKPRQYLVINQKIEIPMAGDRLAIIEPYDGFRIGTMVDFPLPLGFSLAVFDLATDDFLKNFAWARSFIRTPLDDDGSKWQRIRNIYPLLPENPAQSPLVVYNENNFITPLKESDEPAKHKIIDFMGDSCLLGQRLKAKITLDKPGHKFNYLIVEELKKISRHSEEQRD